MAIMQVSNENFDKTLENMLKLQLIHNQLVSDCEIVFTITELMDENESAKPLIRACYKEMFSLIDADLFLLNQFNPYPGYDDKHQFKQKLKKTYKQHALQFDKETIRIYFNDSNAELLWECLSKRNQVTHPKSFECIEVDKSDYIRIKKLLLIYKEYISKLMNGVFIEGKFSSKDYL